MSIVAAFHSMKELMKPPIKRLYHNNTACEVAKEIQSHERRPGTGGFRLCAECAKLNQDGR